MIEILRITYYLYEFKKNRRGTAPIYCKLTTDGTGRQQFSTGLYVVPGLWDKEAQCVRGTSEDAVLINRRLQDITIELKGIERRLYEADGNVSLGEIYALYKQKTVENHTLCGIFRERLDKMSQLIGKEYSPATWQKFREVFAHVERYIHTTYGLQDIPIRNVDYRFIKQFEEALMERGLKAITINKIMQRVRQMVNYAFRCNYIQQDPFVEYKPLKERKRLVFLTQEELHKLEDFHFVQMRLETVKNIYLFSVYTGLAYHEAQALQPKHIAKGFDGRNWIALIRQKTDREISIPLLPQAEQLIVWFREHCQVGNYVQPRISNQKINSYLREIADIVGIDKKLTHHTARKTFATTILLYNDVPIEVVSKLLGHSDISVTQRSYAQVLNKNISNHIGRLEKQLLHKNADLQQNNH